MNKNRVIHQFVHTLSYGDAISGEALALRRAAQELGYKSEIYAINIDPKYKSLAHKYTTYDQTLSGDVILHYSLGSPLNDLYRKLDNQRRILIYHNLTPARWFSGVNPRIMRDILRGLEELPELCKISDSLWADSKFNAHELQNLGFKAEVLELPIDPSRWSEPANQGIASLVSGEGGVQILHVGRLAPNKCIEDIIRAFYFLHHYIDSNSRLWLVGIDIDTEIYSFSLKRLVYELSLSEAVNFVGRFADSEVRALYENATVYFCASEHEGFCMPVVEAMYFGLPVVAYSSSALTDTVGAGGVLFSEKRPAEIAEVLYKVSKDSSLRARLVEAGKARVASLSYDKFCVRFKELIENKQPANIASLSGAGM